MKSKLILCSVKSDLLLSWVTINYWIGVSTIETDSVVKNKYTISPQRVRLISPLDRFLLPGWLARPSPRSGAARNYARTRERVGRQVAGRTIVSRIVLNVTTYGSHNIHSIIRVYLDWQQYGLECNDFRLEIIRESDIKTDYSSFGIKIDYFLIRARIEPIKTD